MNRLHKKRLALPVLVGALLTGLASAIAADDRPTSPAMTDRRTEALADLSIRLGQLLQDLDQQESRRLGRIVDPRSAEIASEPDAGFLPVSFDSIAGVLRRYPDRALLVFTRRGHGVPVRVELQGALLVAIPKKNQVALHVPTGERAQNAYAMKAQPDDAWAALLSTIWPSGVATPSGVRFPPLRAASPAEAVIALARARSTAFVFLLAKTPPSLTIDRLIVVPDTVMITLRGGGGAAKADPTQPQLVSTDPVRPITAKLERSGTTPPVGSLVPPPSDVLQPHRPPPLQLPPPPVVAQFGPPGAAGR